MTAQRFVRYSLLAATGMAMMLAAAGLGSGATKPAAAEAGGFNDPLAVAYNTFYPRNLRVEQGSSVTFSIFGFHTVTFPKKGTQLAQMVIPGSTLNPATNDPAGRPYWWGGATPALGLNPVAAAPTGGTAVTGAKTVSSGFVQGDKPRFTVTFPKRGAFEVRCVVHPRMRGKVTVVAKGSASADTPAEVARKTTRDKAADLKAARRDAKKFAARSSTATVLVGPGDARQEGFLFAPKKATVATGGTVTFRMDGANEIHTVSFGPSDFLDTVGKRTFEGQGLAIDPEGAYPSDPPPAVPVLTPTLHGNGYLNSGVLTEPGDQGEDTFRVTFSSPGVYPYRCMVHSDMRGSVTVG